MANLSQTASMITERKYKYKPTYNIESSLSMEQNTKI